MTKMYFLPFRPAFDSAGITVPGSQHWFTLAGTNTPSAPFTDVGLTIHHPNPVVSNGIGYLPPVYLDPNISYRVRVYDENAEVGVDTPLEEYDPYVPALANADLLSELASSSGSSLIGFLQSGIGAESRTVEDKLRDFVDVRDFGVMADGTTDDTVKFQNAVTAAGTSGHGLRLPTRDVIRLTSTITSTNSIKIVGDGVAPFTTTPGTRGPGSWLYFDHSGQGLVFNGTGSSTISGVHLSNFGTFRNQPTPAPGWAPNSHDFDIVCIACDATLTDLMLLNPTKGIKIDKGYYGRLNARNIAGHAFQVLLDIDHLYDVAFLDTIRQWTFWSDDANVHAYTYANLDTIYLRRVDNPQLSNIFSIRDRSSIRIGQSASVDAGAQPGGSVSKLMITNLGSDIGVHGLWIDSTVSNLAEVDITNFYAQCDSLTGSIPILIDGSNSIVTITNASMGLAAQNIVKVNGSGNLVRLGGQLRFYGWDSSATSAPAVYAASGNTVNVDTAPLISSPGSGGTYGGSGTIKSVEWRDWTPTITPGSGSFTTITTNTAKYRNSANRVDFELEFTITTPGTGTGAINATLPITAGGTVVAHGYIASGASSTLTGFCGPGQSTIAIYKYDASSSAIGAGYVIRVTGSYRV